MATKLPRTVYDSDNQPIVIVAINFHHNGKDTFVTPKDIFSETGDDMYTDAMLILCQPGEDDPKIQQKHPIDSATGSPYSDNRYYGNLVFRRAATIDFLFDRDTPNNPRPIGISFKATNLVKGGVRGDTNLPLEGIELIEYDDGRKGIRVRNTWDDKGPQGEQKVYWKFSIIYQLDTGMIGMIDPGVENEVEN